MIDITKFIPILGFLVAITNIIVQVTKKATFDKIHTNVVALSVAEIITISFGIAYCQINSIGITWYIVASLIVGGFMVAYAAMFGFDKLREVMKWGDSK